MSQSSLMAWLKKPAAVMEPSPARQQQRKIMPTMHETDVKEPPRPNQNNHHLPDSTAPIAEPLCGPQNLSESRKLPPNVQFRPCTKGDIPALKRLTSLLLPLSYPVKFFREIIEDELTNNLTLLAFWHDKPPTSDAKNDQPQGRLVGAIRCRLLAHPPTPEFPNRSTTNRNDAPMLYLSTLVLLSPYRHHGIAVHMLGILIRRAVEDYGIGSVGAHVWEANPEGLEWYIRRGFVEVGREKRYYRRLKPTGAVVMKRDVGVMDLVGDGLGKG